MNKKLLLRIRYWIPHILLVFVMAGSGVMYFAQPDMAAKAFTDLGYPVYTMYFNAIAKLLGAAAILFPVPRFLKEFAYAGYLYIILLATQAVWVMMPGGQWPMLGFVALWTWAYWEFRNKA